MLKRTMLTFLAVCICCLPLKLFGTTQGASALRTALVGEELLFHAADYIDVDSIVNIADVRFYWDFGDYRNISFTGDRLLGVSTTYCYMSPGSYTATLRMVPPADPNQTVPPQDTVVNIPVQVTGEPPVLPPLVSTQPVLELTFDNSIDNTGSASVNLQWVNGSGGYIQGVKGAALDLTGGSYLKITNPNAILAGNGEITISFWSRKRTAGSFGYIFHQYDNAAQLSFGKGSRLNTFILPGSHGMVGVDFRTTDSYTQTRSFYDNGALDLLWHHYAFSYSAAEGKAYLYYDGKKIGEKSNITGSLVSSTVELFLGAKNDGTEVFDGYIDELKIYDRALTRDEIYEGVELLHAEFHGHTAQWIYVQIPERLTADPTNVMEAQLSGGDLEYDIRLAKRSGLAAKERFLLRNAELAGSENPYRLTVRLLDANNSLIYRLEDSFYKRYDGAPKVGIDENNSIRVNGKLFFPVTPWGLNNETVEGWANNGYINTVYGLGFWGFGPNAPQKNVAGWREYLDHAHSFGLKAIGPSMWDGQGPAYYMGNADLRVVRDFVTQLKGHEAMMMWQWLDEPRLYGVSAGTLRSWTRASHDLDDQHLVATNFMGHYYGSDNVYAVNQRGALTYLNNKKQFGRRTAVADVVGFDYYPFDSSHGDSAPGTMNRLDLILKTIHEANFNLLPVFSWVETADAGGATANSKTPWPPTKEQLRMLTWYNVVKGVKGINWFHYFGQTPEENYAEMKTFTRQITELTPVVLGTPSELPVTAIYSAIGSGPDQDEIDIMVREDYAHYYIFAVRRTNFVNQVNYSPQRPLPVNNFDVTVTFDLSTLYQGSGAVGVYEEKRTIAVNNMQFTDNFKPYDVHIYKVPKF